MTPQGREAEHSYAMQFDAVAEALAAFAARLDPGSLRSAKILRLGPFRTGKEVHTAYVFTK